MSDNNINVTAPLHAATKQGKLAAAREVFMDGDKETLQQIGDKTHQLEDAVKDITVSGGASTANAVSYNNETSEMTAVTAQGAIDELAAKNKSQDTTIAAKAEKSDVQASVSELKAKNASQDAEIAKKANSADVTSLMQTEQSRINAELGKKFDKESILQESGEAEDKVMSQKAVSTKLSDLAYISYLMNAEGYLGCSTNTVYPYVGFKTKEFIITAKYGDTISVSSFSTMKSRDAHVVRIAEKDTDGQVLCFTDFKINDVAIYSIKENNCVQVAVFSVLIKEYAQKENVSIFIFSGKKELNTKLIPRYDDYLKKIDLLTADKETEGSVDFKIQGVKEETSSLRSDILDFSNEGYDTVGQYEATLKGIKDSSVIFTEFEAKKGDCFTCFILGLEKGFAVRILEKKDDSILTRINLKNNATFNVSNEGTNKISFLLYNLNGDSKVSCHCLINIVRGNILGIKPKDNINSLKCNIKKVVLNKDFDISVGKYYNSNIGVGTSTKRFYVKDKLFVLKGETYHVESDDFKIYACFYNINFMFLNAITGWFTEGSFTFSPTEDGYLMISFESKDGGDVTEESIKEHDIIFERVYLREIENLQTDNKKNIVGIANNTTMISSLNNRVSRLEKTDASESISGFSDEEKALITNIFANKGVNDALFTVVADTHYSPSKYIGNQNKSVMEKHATVISKLSDYIGVDFVAHCGDMVSGEDYSDKNTLLSDFKKISNLFRGLSPFVYSLSHHELYFNGQYSGGISREQAWNIAGSMNNYFDLSKKFGSEINNDSISSMYYYFDNPIKRLRIINLCTVDGGNNSIGYNQLVWLRDYALKNVPNDYGVILLGHLPPTMNLIPGVGNTLGFSTYSDSDKPSNGLDLNSIVNDAISKNVNILAYICGHTHFDDVYTLKGSLYPVIMINCDIPFNNKGSIDVLGDYNLYDRTVSTIKEYCVDFVIPSIKKGIIRLCRFGAGYDRVIYTRPKIIKKGETLDLSGIVGTSNDYKSLDESVATIDSGIVTAINIGQTQVIFYNKSQNIKYFIEIIVNNIEL